MKMKLRVNLQKIQTLAASLAVLIGSLTPHPTLGQTSEPPNSSILPATVLAIESIQLEGTNVVVKVDVSSGIKTVLLESRTRLGSGNWEPRAVERLGDFSTPVKVITFRFPMAASMEMLRVRGDSTDPLPPSFYTGVSSFGVPSTTSGENNVFGAEVTAQAGDKAAAPVAAPGATTTTRTVVESDIWNIEGDVLYFFNQYRGLQVIDIAKPDQPVLRGTYNLPAAGEQMYLLDTNHVILLAHDYCGGYSSTSEGLVILLEVTDGQPKIVAQLAVPGAIRESRLVGTALYTVSERYRPILMPAKQGGTQEVWEWGSEISSFDLSRFSSPEQKFKEWVPGYGNAIMATDRFLFVATPQQGGFNGWINSDVRVFDISAPDGTTQALSTIAARGRVKDKFKMNLNGDTFTLVSETWGNPVKTQVETYSLADPKNPKSLANLPIIEREQLYATRFDGDRLYVVTFFRVDPLWIIDLSDPTQPTKVGELQIPGWSTYLHPLGDRLLAIGIDNTNGWRTVVQLFDVHNPAKPTLASKVFLGEQYSSSEANYDEKAFGVLPDQNLILVPYSTWSPDGSFQGVHLIDLERDTLRKRGAIEHELQARRATVHRDRILSVSGVELLSVDATDRDHPKVVSTTELSWAADRIFLQGAHLVEVEGTWANQPALRVVLADQTDKALSRTKLANLPVLGTTVQDKRLYVAQGRSTEVIWPQIYNPTNYFPIKTNLARLILSVFDLTKLPELPLLGRSETSFANRYWNTLDALWPKPGVLVWSSKSYWGPWLGIRSLAPGAAVDVAVGAPTATFVDSKIAFAPWWRGSDSVFIAYDVQDATAPKLVSETNLRDTNSWWSFSQPFATAGLVYVSHQSSEYLKDLQPPPYVSYRWDGTKQIPTTNYPPPGAWVQRYFLDVIDYADPKAPVTRKPVNIPGSLIGLSHQGAMLYTQGYRYGDVTKWTDWAEWLDASAYDGVQAHLVDSLALTTTYPRPILVFGKSIFLGRASDQKDAPANIETWTVSDAGKFARTGLTTLSEPANGFKSFGDLLTVQFNNRLALYNAANPDALQLRGGGDNPGCFGFNLDSADGTVDRGLWIPLGAYGVTKIDVKR